jgi:hypothetical protein
VSHLLGFDIWGGWGTTLAIKAIIVLAIVPLTALILGYVFLLKMMSHMQSRLGPMDPGGFHGWYQLIGDGIKFLQKEDIMPAEADRRVFALAPAFLVFVVIPAGPRLVVQPLDVGVFYALAVSSLSVIGVLMAGWASSNKYALLGALRAAGQLIAYELPLVLAVVGVVVQAGTMNLQGIVHFQQTGQLFGWSGIGFPLILTQFVGFALFMVAAQAELTLHGRVHGLSVLVLLHRRVRHRVRVRRARGHAVPRRLVHTVGARNRSRLARTARVVHEGHARGVLHVLGALHLPALPGRPAAGHRVEVADPDRADQHHDHGDLEGGVLMGGKRSGGLSPAEAAAKRPNGSGASSRPVMKAARRSERVGRR